MQSVVRCFRTGARCRSIRSQICNPTRVLHCSRTAFYPALRNIRDASSSNSLVIHSTTDNPYVNLALEHHLLTQSHPQSRILIFYTNRPCVVIGRNQNPWSECNLSMLQSGLNGRAIDLVRRRSGGGTVFHDEGNLNFSVIVPNDIDFNRRRHAEMVVTAIQAANYGDHASRLFSEIWVNNRHDIVIRRGEDIYKVSGSAFKLTRGRALHHGTLLHSSPNLTDISRYLRSPSSAYIIAKGVESVRSPVSNLYNVTNHQRPKLQQAIVDSVVAEFAKLYPNIQQHSLDEHEITQLPLQDGLNELQTADWKFGQTPRFEFNSPSFGGHQLSMSVNHGIIEEASHTELKGQKLTEIAEWSVKEESALNGLLQQTFPKFAIETSHPYNMENSTISDSRHMVQRQMKDGSIEIEKDLNTIEVK